MTRFERGGGIEGPVVQGFSVGGFSVDGGVYDALLLTPQSAERWTPPDFADLRTEDLAPLLAIEPVPEFLILGTGTAYRVPPPGLVAALEAGGIGIEAMDSRAAARTWGLLRGEQRWIVAAIMPLG